MSYWPGAHASQENTVSASTPASRYIYINLERTESKTDNKQSWMAPSCRLQDLYPKGEIIKQIFGSTEDATSSFHVQESQDDEICQSLAHDLQMFGLMNSSAYKCLTADLTPDPEPTTRPPPEVPMEVIEMLKNGPVPPKAMKNDYQPS